MAKKRKRKSAFVPRLLVPVAAAVGVVPACVLASCSGDVTTASNGGSGGSVSSSSSSSSAGTFSVTAVAYPAYEAGAQDAPADALPDIGFTVAAVAYPAYEAGPG
jgi:hypothetical protein